MEIKNSITLFFIFFIILNSNAHAQVCTDSNVLSQKTSKENTQLFEKFVKQKVIRDEAEKMLSMLIKSKSPIINIWVKARQLDPFNQPEKVAWEWDKYYAKAFIINKYPTQNSVIDKSVENLFQDLIDKNLSNKIKKKFESIFLIEQKNAIATIGRFPLNEKEKKKIIETISSIKLYWPKKLTESKFEKFPLEFMDWSLAYDPAHNEINIGLNALLHSEENLHSLILHEIAHSFDSCRWSQKEKEEWPFEKIGNCLRSFAQKRDDSRLNELLNQNKITPDLFQFMKSNPTCNNTLYPPIGIQADQLPETFADWFSAEATDVKKTSAHFRDDLCEERNLNPGSSYLSNKDRLIKLYLAKKSIQLKIKSEATFCSF